MLGRRRIAYLCLAAFFAGLPSCLSPGDGPSPPNQDMYYPVGLAVSPGGHTLYVANSDFDLQYNAGTIQAFDLDRIHGAIPKVWEKDPDDPKGYPSCVPVNGIGKLKHNTQPLLYPGACEAIDINAPPDGLGSLVGSFAQIGAFAADIVAVGRDAKEGFGARLFLPVRGDPSLTWLEIQDDRDESVPIDRTMYCGQSESSPRCDSTHRAGESAETNHRRVVMPPEPYGIAVSEHGNAIVIAHQTGGNISLVTNPWDGIPTLQFILGGLPYGLVGIAALPEPAYVAAKKIDYQPGFLTTYRAAAQVDLIRYFDDAAAAPDRPFISLYGRVGITVNASGVDSRGIAIDATDRKDCEKGCGGEETCLASCAKIPAQVYIASRSPSSLLIGETRTTVSPTGSDDLITIYDSIPLPFGPSRVGVGKTLGTDGRQQTRVFVSCFDSRYLSVYNPKGRRIEAHIRTGRGAHSIAFDPDPTKPYLYLAHFTDSYIGVVDLDESHSSSFLSIVATLGVPKPPRESK